MIDRVYQTVRMLANSELRGNIKPADFNKALFNVMTEKVEEYPFELSKWHNRENRGLVGNGQENIPDLIQEKMDHFLAKASLTYNGGIFTLPNNLRYIDSILHQNKSEVERCKNASEFNHLRKFKHTQPSLSYPIGLRAENTIEILPATIIDEVTIYYRRTLKMPKWTYIVVGGAELFNPSAADFQDIDMHVSEEDDIVSRLLVKFGINLKEPDLQASGNADEAQEFNKQNSN